MKKEREIEKYVVKKIQDKTVVLKNLNNSNEEKEVPKYRLPLGITEGEELVFSEFGMYEQQKND